MRENISEIFQDLRNVASPMLVDRLVRAVRQEKGARAAVKRQGLHLMNYDVEPVVGGGFAPHFYTKDRADCDELWSRGFQAEINPEKAA